MRAGRGASLAYSSRASYKTHFSEAKNLENDQYSLKDQRTQVVQLFTFVQDSQKFWHNVHCTDHETHDG